MISSETTYFTDLDRIKYIITAQISDNGINQFPSRSCEPVLSARKPRYKPLPSIRKKPVESGKTGFAAASKTKNIEYMQPARGEFVGAERTPLDLFSYAEQQTVGGCADPIRVWYLEACPAPPLLVGIHSPLPLQYVVDPRQVVEVDLFDHQLGQLVERL